MFLKKEGRQHAGIWIAPEEAGRARLVRRNSVGCRRNWHCCRSECVLEIKATRGGFVALRAAAGPTARLLHRMRPGDEVLFRPERRAEWQRGTYRRGGRFRSGRNPEGDQPTAVGWMHKDLVAPDSCG